MDNEPFHINLDDLGKQTGQFQVQMVQVTTSQYRLALKQHSPLDVLQRAPHCNTDMVRFCLAYKSPRFATRGPTASRNRAFPFLSRQRYGHSLVLKSIIPMPDIATAPNIVSRISFFTFSDQSHVKTLPCIGLSSCFDCSQIFFLEAQDLNVQNYTLCRLAGRKRQVSAVEASC